VAPSAREDNSVLVLSEIAGFRIYYGVTSGDYSNAIDIDDHTATQAVLDGLPSGTYFVAVTTVDVDGRESTYSAEVVVTV
jgi:fibronectin type 3 domain-containing protein